MNNNINSKKDRIIYSYNKIKFIDIIKKNVFFY